MIFLINRTFEVFVKFNIKRTNITDWYSIAGTSPRVIFTQVNNEHDSEDDDDYDGDFDDDDDLKLIEIKARQ